MIVINSSPAINLTDAFEVTAWDSRRSIPLEERGYD